MQKNKKATEIDPVYSETAYDDAFRTLEGKCDDLLISFVNHMFKENYDNTAVVRRLRNEQYVEHENGSEDKRITDSHFEIIFRDVAKRYHLECESKLFTGEILVRIFEYDSQIAKCGAEKSFYKARFSFQNTGLLLLRSALHTPDSAKIEICTPDGQEISYDLPIIRMSDYSTDDIFENRVYMLIPFLIFNYEDRLSGIDKTEEEQEALIRKYHDIFRRLDEQLENGNLSPVSYDAIIRLTYSVAYKITMNARNVQEKVGDVMRGKVLDLPGFKIYDQGKAEGKAEGRAEGEEERKALKNENELLRKEIEQLKAQLVEK